VNPERAAEHLGPRQVRLLELQPRQVVHLHDRVLGAARVLTRQGAPLAVQTRVGVPLIDHHALPRTDTDESINYEMPISQGVTDDFVNIEVVCYR